MTGPTTADSFYLGELPTDGTVAAAVTARLIQHAVASGVTLQELLSRVGWPSSAAPDPDARVPFRVHFSVWQHVHEHGVPRDFGLTFGDSFELDHLGVLGLLMTHSATVEDAFMQQIRFQRLLLDTPFKPTTLTPRKLVVEHPLLPIAVGLPHMIVAGLVYWLKLLRSLTLEPVRALRVELPHAPLADAERYHAVFGVRPRFEAPRVLLELDRAWWSAPVRAQPSGLEAYLRASAASLLRKLPTRGERLDVVREYMSDELRHGRHPTLAGAAKRASTSIRTLQRSLRGAEISYNALLDETRRQLSIEYLGDARLSIGEVAIVLGYSDPATFYRAFRRWTGVPPGAYRASV